MSHAAMPTVGLVPRTKLHAFWCWFCGSHTYECICAYGKALETAANDEPNKKTFDEASYAK